MAVAFLSGKATARSVLSYLSYRRTAENSLAAVMAHCAELRTGKQQQARDIGPQQQSDGDRERSVEAAKIQLRKKSNEDVLGSYPEQARKNGNTEHWPGRQLAIGQNPIDRKEKQNACCGSRERQPRLFQSPIGEVVDVSKEQHVQDCAFACVEKDAGQAEDHHPQRQPQRNKLI